MNCTKLTLFSLLIILATACSTGKSSYKKGNYYDATLEAVKNLRSNPDSKKSLEIVQKSYPMAIDYYNQKVEQLSMSTDDDKYYSIYQSYEKLNNLADEITRCPAALNVLRPVTYYHTQYEKSKELAIKEQTERVEALLSTRSYTDARLAIPVIEWIKEVNPTSPNIDDLLNKANSLAIVRTIVEHVPTVYSNYEINSSIFYNRIFSYLNNYKKNKQLDFYKPTTAEQLKLVPHEILTINFAKFNVSQLNTYEKIENYESDTISVGTYSNATGESFEAFGTVEAEVTLHHQDLSAKGVLVLEITDYATGEVISKKELSGEYIWSHDWATYNGDERALPDDIYSLTKIRQISIPTPQDMFLLVSDDVYSSATSYLSSYYRRK